MKKFVLFAILFGILSLMSPIVSATEIIGGRLEILTICQPERKSKLCTINTGKERISLLFENQKILPILRSAGAGAKVKIKGTKGKKKANGKDTDHFLCQEIISCAPQSAKICQKQTANLQRMPSQ